MNSYELYKRVLEALKEDEGTFNAAARNWIESGKDPNFKNDEANELFSTAKLCDAAWRNKAINGKVSKRKMIECVRKIAEMNLPNPYDPKEKVEEPKIEEPVEKKVEEPKKHILGVIPEAKAEEAGEENKEDKRLFGKRKNK